MGRSSHVKSYRYQSNNLELMFFYAMIKKEFH